MKSPTVVGRSFPLWRLTLVCLFALGLGGCPTPVPLPPGLSATYFPTDESVAGRADAIPELDRDGDVYLLDLVLGSLDLPRVAPINPDGSFGPVPYGGEPTRIYVRARGLRSASSDFVREAGVPVEPPRLLPCVTVPRDLEFPPTPVGMTTTLDIVVRNDCADSVTISGDGTGARFGEAFERAPETFTIPAVSTLSISVTFTPTAVGTVEDVVSLDLRDAPLGDLDPRFVSVFGDGV